MLVGMNARNRCHWEYTYTQHEHMHLHMQKCVIEHERQKKTEQLTISVSTNFWQCRAIIIFQGYGARCTCDTHTQTRDAIYIIEIFVQCCAWKKGNHHQQQQQRMLDTKDSMTNKWCGCVCACVPTSFIPFYFTSSAFFVFVNMPKGHIHFADANASSIPGFGVLLADINHPELTGNNWHFSVLISVAHTHNPFGWYIVWHIIFT